MRIRMKIDVAINAHCLIMFLIDAFLYRLAFFNSLTYLSTVHTKAFCNFFYSLPHPFECAEE